MTTVASGRWTSAPALVESAIGRKPSVRDERRRHHRAQAALGRLGGGGAGRETGALEVAQQAHQHHAVEHRDAEGGDEADRRRDENGRPRA